MNDKARRKAGLFKAPGCAPGNAANGRAITYWTAAS